MLTIRSPRAGWRTARIAGSREAIALAATLGGQIREARRARRLTQAQLAELVGVEQSWISKLERGLGAGAPLSLWIALGIALDRPFAGALSRPLNREPADAGHLSSQELLLRLASRNGDPGTFELPTRASNPARSIDVCVRDDRHRVLIIEEVWNSMGDLGQATRDHRRKVAEAEALAVAIGGHDGPYRVASCWVLRATAANRALVQRYPAIFRATFAGSSRNWVRALTTGAPPPEEPGLVWVDLAGTQLSEYRRG